MQSMFRCILIMRLNLRNRIQSFFYALFYNTNDIILPIAKIVILSAVIFHRDHSAVRIVAVLHCSRYDTIDIASYL